jgi:type VI secretion system protein ImpB
MSSIQGDLQKIRPPRVHIRYTVQTGNAIERKELPFVVAVLADLSGASRSNLKRLKKREFVLINRMNFDQVLAGIKPSLKVTVPNRIQDNGTDLVFNLEFKGMDDFRPTQVAEAIGTQVAAFGRALELRRQIKKLLMAMDGNDDVQDMIQRLINDRAALRQLCQEAGRDDAEPREARP